MLRRIVPSRAAVSQFATAGAWFFIVVSLLHLLWAVGAKWGDTAGTAKLYHTIVDGRSYDAPGLTYSGTFGLLLAMAQLALVSAAAVASKLTWGGTLRYRRIGHVVLCAWAGLWALDLIWLASIDHELQSFAQAALLCVLAGCTGYRAVRGWTPVRRNRPPIESAGGDGMTGGTPPGNLEPPAVHRSLTHAMRSAVPALRRRVSSGLMRLSGFTRRQAERLAPSSRA